MLNRQSYIFAIAGGAIGLCALLMLNKIQSDGIKVQNYQSELNRMTAQISALTESMNSLTKLTMQLDKSFKQNKPVSSAHHNESLNQDPAAVNNTRQTHTVRQDSPSPDSAADDYLSGQVVFPSGEEDSVAVTDEWQIRQQENQIISSFENHFASQGTDANWAQRTEQSIVQALADEIFSNSQHSSISCRATLCKIDTQHSDMDSELVFLEQINSRAGFNNTESFYTRDVKPDGTIVMTFYISRDGHRLPRFSTTGDIVPG